MTQERKVYVVAKDNADFYQFLVDIDHQTKDAERLDLPEEIEFLPWHSSIFITRAAVAVEPTEEWQAFANRYHSFIIRLDGDEPDGTKKEVLIDEALFFRAAENCSCARPTESEQIEYWTKLGEIAELNPDLTFRQVSQVLRNYEQYGVPHYGNTKT